ncbi:MAG: PTS sugar transporter subunit IIA [Erysipelotrichaceae bacterium]
MIEQLIKKENIVVNAHADTWQQAINLSLQQLVKNGYCTDEYETAVLKSTEENGFYYCLTDDLALIHAKAFEAVNETQLAVTVLDSPVAFSDEHPDIRILVALVAKDGNKHMEGIMAVANIFGDDDKASDIINATSADEIYELFINSVE